MARVYQERIDCDRINNLSSMHYIINVNAKLVGILNISEGCNKTTLSNHSYPLSPFLFLIVAEGMSALMAVSIGSRNIRP